MVERLKSVRAAVLYALVLAFAWRAFLVYAYPGNYAFDGLQRWAGREHVLVQSWLPAFQAVLYACDRIGLTLAESRTVLAGVGALGIALATALAGRLGGWKAAWAFVPFALYGPHVCWTIAPYQEGVFLAVATGALLLATYERWFVADLLMGLTGLVRYEGWPFVAVWILWRRDPRALLSLWGIAAWLGGKYGLHWEGYKASPVDIRDWEGMFTRFSPAIFLRDTGYNIERTWDSGAFWWIVGTAVGAPLVAVRWKRLLWVWLGVQVAITCAWMIALERSMSRMMVVPVMLFAPVGAVGFARLWEVARCEAEPSGRIERLAARVGARGVVAVLLLLVGMMVFDGWWRVQREIAGNHWERAALRLMQRCPECTWWVEPRANFGPRKRHDGCEVIQGVSDLRHGIHFWCAPWVDPAEASAIAARTRSRVQWQEDKLSYMVWRTWTGQDAGGDAAVPDASDEGGGDGG
ncbi:MAG: hypothetical protein FJ102_10095 [Deltaproteobacteria bacterium]|nr:hypothetical protein [Deltaproteobacteria bacterium]